MRKGKMRKLVIAAVLMLVAGDNAISGEQVPAPAPIPAPPVAQSPAPPSGGTQCSDFAKLADEADEALKVANANPEKSSSLQAAVRNFIAALARRFAACAEPHESPAQSSDSVRSIIDGLRALPNGDDCWGHYTARMGDVLCTGSRVKLITDPD
jgi:hypothetical protein